MRICAIATPDGPVAAEIRGDRLFSIDGELAQRVLGGSTNDVKAGADLVGFNNASLLAPVNPRKVVGIGLNYKDHIAESGDDPPEAPVVFAKFPSSIIGPDEPIVINGDVAERVDWEVELTVVVGKRMRNVSADDALSYVFGYTVANDVSARDAQFADGQWVRGKSMDTFCPVGPWVVTADEIPDPQSLGLRTRVNGELMQDASTSLMLFSVAELLAFCSASFTLEPGDLLLTGTPWGCGEFMSPRRSLRDGDTVEVEIDGIGLLSNPVVERVAVPA